MRLVPLPMKTNNDNEPMVWVNPEQVITVTLTHVKEQGITNVVYLALESDLSYDVEFTSKEHAYEFIDELRK